MAKALGIGGVFFKSKDPQALGRWYADALGVPIDPSYGGATFQPAAMPEKGATTWAPFKHDTDYFAPSDQAYMINLVVDDLDGALAQVEKAGATLVGDPEDYDYGRFGWFLDPEGNKVELWEPK
jgi:predicted enzyme related to lactoylglutathione lyase